ncbi:MAG: bifunctional ADP-heptose synthase [Candidatus Nanoarchaeia archaeon]|nr:bifunctional ADP-heptose synthase [Candidatus Nanoarchaeia archaeon]
MPHRLKPKKVAVVGDFSLDFCRYNLAHYLSKEEPCPVVYPLNETKTLGGAGNTANNVNSLGGIVIPITIIGKDEAGDLMINLFRRKGVDTSGIIQLKERKTHVYEKIYASSSASHGQHNQVVRIDTIPQGDLTKEQTEILIEKIKEKLDEIDAIIVADYSKGIVTKELIKFVSTLDKIKIGDSRPKINEFSNFSVLAPNEFEAYFGLYGNGYISSEDLSDEMLTEIGIKLKDRLNLKYLVITRGSKGMMVFDDSKGYIINSVVTDAVDVTGAGDTVAAAIALGLASGLSLIDSAKIANYAGGVVVRKKGTATCTVDEILELKEKIKKQKD